ncbi:hypothetical protein VH570_19445 [Sphingobium sp. HT1-2]|uniref:hypothetical protein n=1 Tax=Sphingobium sp. HT1-2 TaxID=3111640 RepID=UPI003C05A264
MTHALEAERAEMIRRSDLARGFAAMASDHATASLMKAKARHWGQAALALADAIDGPLPPDIAAMDDAALLDALEVQTMYDLKFIASSFGGGWLIPISEEARETYSCAFDEEPSPLAPIGGQEGWIIEPQDLATVLRDIHADGFVLLEA